MKIEKIIKILLQSKKSGTILHKSILKAIFYRMRGKTIWAHHKVCIYGLKNIETNGLLRIGTGDVGFMHKNDITYLNVKGKLIFKSSYNIGRGCRFAIGENASCILGEGSITAVSNFIIKSGLEIGNNTVISWNCQFLDEDFHEIEYEDKITKPREIKIGNNVWIGNNVTILKGVKIADNCVIAAGAMVTKSCEEEGALLAGVPAKIIKHNVRWRS